ncbi:MAG TPA: peptidase, partial [Gemmatimonadaceae bacterium]
DTWTANPRRDGAIAAQLGDAPDSVKWAAMKAPELRDPRGYIIPSDQADFPTATKFINALRETGITVLRATRDFDVKGKRYPSGSFVVQTAQAFRPHIMDMFEAQVHPDVIPYPGANPTPPYDNAGWTLAFQMGVQFDRILDGFTGPFEKVTAWNTTPPAGKIVAAAGAAGYVTNPRPNDAFIALNRLLKSNEDVVRLSAPLSVNGTSYPAGALYVRAKPTTAANLQKLAAPLGLDFVATTTAAPSSAIPMRAPRVGLWDTYGGSMPSGWTRWILEQFEFPFERVFAPQLDAGNLNAKYDVLVFVTGAIPGAGGGGRGGRGGGGGSDTEIPLLPAEYRDQVGRVTLDKTLPKIREFIEKGGTVLAIGSSATNLSSFLKLPIESQLVENGAPLPRTKFYSPGSLISARIDTSHPLGQGMTEHADVFFDDSPVFKLGAGAEAAGVKTIAWYDSKTPLRSGWAWGQQYLENGVVAVEAKVGAGRVLLFGPEILQRAQPHGTFKFLFNGIYTSIGSKSPTTP